MTNIDDPDSNTIELAPIRLDGRPVKAPGEDQADLTTVLGKRNRVRLGAPRYSDYVAELLSESSTLPREIEQLVQQGYDLHRVRPSLTLLPDGDCVFVAAELSLELLTTPRADGGNHMTPAIAYEVKPTVVLQEVPYNKTSTKSRELGTDIGKLLAKVTEENVEERNGVTYVQRVTGHGVNYSEVGWRLRATPDHELLGDVLGLETIVRTPTGAQLSGQFRITVDIAVRTGLDKWLTQRFGPRSNAPVLSVAYPLSG
ncbi:hypothetical protein [Streptomyces alboniger]|uniref:Uncharacterized protein n=1 Tax=Streptomyces alboniger TaxID=132473 RepID=A0A5J6HE67_STRAD|nr:hypothetical protein [Streptomyces alboniger]QEV16564.1 hypothetical protein CP975_02735 [Streptomyces alboniger]